MSGETKRFINEAPVPIALIILSLLVAFPLLLGALPPTAPDAYGDEIRFLGFYRLTAEWWAEGRFPLWNDRFGFGIPLAGDLRSFAFNPLSWTALFLPAERSFSLLFALGFPFASVGMYLFLRAMRLSRSAAFLGGWLFGCTGWSWIRFYIGHLDFIFSYGSIPWILAGLRSAFEHRRAKRLLLAVPGWVMVVVSARPETMLIAAYLTILFAFVWSRPSEGILLAARRSVIATTLIGLVTLLVAFLPFSLILDFVLGSGRFAIGAHAEALQEMQRVQRIIPRTLLQFLLPRSLGVSPGPYYWGSPLNSACIWIGAIPLFLQLAIPWKARSWKEDGVWAGLALFGVLVAFNDRLPFLEWARTIIPGFAFISGPTRLLFLLHLAIAVLSAVAFDRLMSRPADRRGMILAVGGAAIAIIAGMAAIVLPTGDALADTKLEAMTGFAFITWKGLAVMLREIAIAGGLIGLAALLWRCRPVSPLLLRGLLILAILESAWLLAPYWRFSTVEEYDRRLTPLEAQTALIEDPGRSWLGAPYREAWQSFYRGTSTLDGWHPFTPHDVVMIGEAFRSTPARPAFRLIGADHVLHETAPAAGWIAAELLEDSKTIWTRPDALGRLYLASRTEPPGETFNDSLLRMDHLAGFSGALMGGSSWKAAPAETPTVTITQWSRSRIALEIRASTPLSLILAERPSRFRRFLLNGVEVPSEPANIIACGIRVPGECNVVIEHRLPPGLLVAGLLAFAGAVGLGLVARRWRWSI